MTMIQSVKRLVPYRWKYWLQGVRCAGRSIIAMGRRQCAYRITKQR